MEFWTLNYSIQDSIHRGVSMMPATVKSIIDIRKGKTMESNKKVYFGFALADSMFSGDCEIKRKILSVEQAKIMVEAATPCINPSHAATIDAMRGRYGIDVKIPDAPPQVCLASGDSLVVMAVRGLPRLTDRHEYSEEEIAQATFQFTQYNVV